MRFLTFKRGGRVGLGVADGETLRGRLAGDDGYPGSLAELLAAGGDALAGAGRALKAAPVLDPAEIDFLPPLGAPGKIICLGLNYADHAAEGGFQPPTYPTVFGRFASSLIGHGAPIVRPRVSTELDYEGEMVAVIGRGGRHIPLGQALDHVAGYSIFNDGSVRDYQFKSPQWTMGKNFDATGAFGPYFVTPDELPAGAKGLHLETRLNGQVVQSASTTDMIFDVASTIAILSEALTLDVGDVLVTGTPAGIGYARTPKLFMKPGDLCEVEIDGLGVLSNGIIDE